VGLHDLMGLLSVTEQLFDTRPILKAALFFTVIGGLAELIFALLQALNIRFHLVHLERSAGYTTLASLAMDRKTKKQQ
jgi:hypothetical protein